MLRWAVIQGRAFTLWGGAPVGTAWFLILQSADGAYELYLRPTVIGKTDTSLGTFPSMDDAKFAAELLGEPEEMYKRLNTKEG